MESQGTLVHNGINLATLEDTVHKGHALTIKNYENYEDGASLDAEGGGHEVSPLQ